MSTKKHLKYQNTKDSNILNEAVVVFGSSPFSTLEAILSVDKHSIKIRSDVDLINFIREGLSTEVVKKIASILNVTIDKLAQLLHVSPRTIQRKANLEMLNSPTSEHLVNIAEVIRVGIEVLGNKDAFNKWSKMEVKSLDFQKPIDLLDTSHGCKMVSDVLNRIAHGVYS